ncbi:SDR family NAD(P)-dependent oxidoreductase [Streptomyces ipomoeae]|uniref:SDR family NAD(P)-dependent oxidoreductase n=1 Tax=Streptomyces ipomoeae TaxID=103232 RepID=UPI001C677CB1|nr:SDR family NAD(P)-dependent oxidoreductase [Streptomyces ipomoeae]MDX2937207.1 SDR family NAD(P)-dependent oxidoreductase [Streptomyces ipomoeae]
MGRALEGRGRRPPLIRTGQPSHGSHSAAACRRDDRCHRRARRARGAAHRRPARHAGHHRRPGKRDSAVRRRILPLDLASLTGVRAFADAVARQLDDARIGILVLNAGVQSAATDKRSADGYELTFAVNHLAHYLLARLPLPLMADHGHLVITTSSTHDPANTPIAPPKTMEPQQLAHPSESGFGSGVRAYSSSKLCNLLTARALAVLDEVMVRRISVIAFNPGLTGGTSLGRGSSRARRVFLTLLMRTVFRVVGLFKPEYVMSTAERSGELLAEVALGTLTPPPGRIYVSLVKSEATFPDPSELARSRDRLGRESAAMVGRG